MGDFMDKKMMKRLEAWMEEWEGKLPPCPICQSKGLWQLREPVKAEFISGKPAFFRVVSCYECQYALFFSASYSDWDTASR